MRSVDGILNILSQERLRALQLAEDSILTRLQQQQQQPNPSLRNDSPLSPVKAPLPTPYAVQQDQRQRKDRPVSSSGLDRPYGTEITMADMLAHSKRLDDALVSLRWEQEQLEAELAKLPEGAGKTSAQRKRKAEVEERLKVIESQINNVRTQLRKLTGKWP